MTTRNKRMLVRDPKLLNTFKAFVLATIVLINFVGISLGYY